MFPIKDNNPSKHFPIINWLIILVNLAVFIYELRLPKDEIEPFFNAYGLVPNEIPAFNVSNLFKHHFTMLLPFLTNTFLHGGFGHFFGNMWTLFIFGDNVEDKMGHGRYLLFYLLTGILASATHFYLYSESGIPAIGASGAISAVMGAYMIMFPKAKIVFFVPLFIIIPLFFTIPAFIYLGLWFLAQFYQGYTTLQFTGDATGIAFWAHIGGFAAGILLHWLFIRRKKRKRGFI
ncbi:MAG: rhomboid family intramembrane serine protease [bacterium]